MLNLQPKKQFLNQTELFPKLKAKILWWTGEDLLPEFINAVQPIMAIASNSRGDNTDISEPTLSQLQTANIDVYQTSRDGAIQWTYSNSNQVQSLREREDVESSI